LTTGNRGVVDRAVFAVNDRLRGIESRRPPISPALMAAIIWRQPEILRCSGFISAS